jgi:hypothetical protein
MTASDRAGINRLMLQVERDLVAQARLRTLLVDADSTVAIHRRELRIMKARIRRDSRLRTQRALPRPIGNPA